LAETEFFSAAFFALISLTVAAAMAFWYQGQLTSGSSKALCWVVPVAGLIVLIALVYEGIFGRSGGFRPIALGLGAAVLWVLAVVYPLLQFVFGFLAKLTDSGER